MLISESLSQPIALLLNGTYSFSILGSGSILVCSEKGTFQYTLSKGQSCTFTVNNEYVYFCPITESVTKIQLEQKPYTTSFIDGTRSPETLTIPWEYDGGAFCWESYIIPGQARSSLSAWIPLIRASKGSDYIEIGYRGDRANKCLHAVFYQNGNWRESSGIDINFSPDDMLFVSLSFDGTTASFGAAKVGQAMQFVSLWPTTPNGGSYTIKLNANAVGTWRFDDLRISNRARSDEEITAAYASGQPLPVEKWTTLKIYFDELDNADLLVTTDGRLEPLNLTVTHDSRYDIFPALKEFSDEVPGRHGKIYFGSKLGSRLLELHVASDEGLTPEQKEELKRKVARYLNPVSGPKNLMFADEPKKMYPVKYAGKIDITQYADWMEFTIPFKMANPYIIGSTEKYFSGSGIITNSGNAETPLIIEITGNITNPTITLGSYVLTYNGTIPSGQTLVVDTEKMTVELNGENVLYNWSGGFPKLQPGDNLVSADSKVTFKWRDRWL